MKVKKGSKKRFTSFLKVFEKAVEMTATETNKELARRITRDAKEAIENQEFDWTPLSSKYLARKISEGYDPRTLVRTGEYKDAISWGVTHGKIWAGIPSRKIHEDSGMPLFKLARIHEFGTATIPPRPLWRPILARHLTRRKKFRNAYRAAVMRTIRRLAK